jgi:methylmalonyl-CoA mutase C-terminal domain/subunit
VLQEDAQVLGISSLSGAHMEYTIDILDMLRAQGLDDVLVVVGGTIPQVDAEQLMARGVGAVFTPGTRTEEVIRFVEEHAPVR